ncbi:MAG: patatin-like phospholipase family protein [Nitrospinae bacterium]|nr:patatin-like phospholipase family protein [Nitrospinota bacterium]
MSLGIKNTVFSLFAWRNKMSQFKNLVFEGGGVKGIAYVGAVQALADNEILPDISRVAGTSAGAITAALLALGADGTQLRSILEKADFKSFMDGIFLGNAVRLFRKYGWFKGDAFSEWMKDQVGTISGNPDMTFGELDGRAKIEPQKYRKLHIVGTNLSTQRTEEFSAIDTPDTTIWEAVRLSMSIPLFFASVGYKSGVCVDGGVSWNYPIDIFDDKKYLSRPDNALLFDVPTYTRYHDDHVYNKETLGFRVDTKDEIAAEMKSWELPRKDINDVGEYAMALSDFALGMANKMHLHKNDWHRTVFIDSGDVSFTNFSLPKEKIDMLVNKGVSCTEEYFKWFNNRDNNVINRVVR